MKLGHVFPEEESAVSLLLTLSWVMPVLVVISSLFDLVMVFLYQKLLHPWRRILQKVRIQEVLRLTGFGIKYLSVKPFTTFNPQ